MEEKKEGEKEGGGSTKLKEEKGREVEIFFGFVVEILFATSAVRPRADVAYCIHALSRRLTKTRNWTVGLMMTMAESM